MACETHSYFSVLRAKIAPVVLSVPGEQMIIIKDPLTGIKTYTVNAFNPRTFYTKNYLVPIPQSEIDKNPLLKQNPGY